MEMADSIISGQKHFQEVVQTRLSDFPKKSKKKKIRLGLSVYALKIVTQI
jgi:hypothetical protein